MTPFHLLPEVLSDVDFAPAKAVKEPSKRWRNWVSAPFSWIHAGTGRVVGPGNVEGVHVWPSKEVAEVKASEALAAWDGWVRRGGRYLGAFPEGEQP